MPRIKFPKRKLTSIAKPKRAKRAIRKSALTLSKRRAKRGLGALSDRELQMLKKRKRTKPKTKELRPRRSTPKRRLTPRKPGQTPRRRLLRRRK